MGSSHVSLWNGRKRWGRGKYFMGSTPTYMAAVALYRMAERPYVLSGLGILLGLRRGAPQQGPAHGGPRPTSSYLRRFELESLLFGKTRTANRYHDRIRRDFPARADLTAADVRFLAIRVHGVSGAPTAICRLTISLLAAAPTGAICEGGLTHRLRFFRTPSRRQS